ncbi:hypothetical protein [Streptomyces sp. NPDC056452]|uniref:hypothetical protein n=1 Tax=Streptomyces sp. NPDC056452 TaxID=3345821 RepID=UPI00369FC443
MGENAEQRKAREDRYLEIAHDMEWGIRYNDWLDGTPYGAPIFTEEETRDLFPDMTSGEYFAALRHLQSIHLIAQNNQGEFRIIHNPHPDVDKKEIC